jgi:hypothetical protein
VPFVPFAVCSLPFAGCQSSSKVDSKVLHT